MKNAVFCFVISMVFIGPTQASIPNYSDDDSDQVLETMSEPFENAEATFKIVMEKIMAESIHKKLTKADLYRAATAGMLKSLDPAHKSWNALISPAQRNEMNIDMSGHVAGIGLVFDFDKSLGHGKVIRLIANSPAEKSGIQVDDRILSINGQSFKGKSMMDMTNAIRGEVGKFVQLKILHLDKIVEMKIKRELVPWTPISYQSIDGDTGLLTIGFFNVEAPKMVEKILNDFNNSSAKSLIIDVRNCEGGSFDDAVKTAGLFLPKNSIVTQTRYRDGKIKELRSTQPVLKERTEIVILTDHGTYSAAELFVAALKENRKVRQIGESTAGKWSAQKLEELPNKYSIKFTVMEFLSPKGITYQDKGILPDIEVTRPDKTSLSELQLKSPMSARLLIDNQLKTAVNLIRTF